MAGADDYQVLLGKIAQLERMVGGMMRPATVKKVEGDRVRAVLGKGADGKEVLGPFLDTANHRGEARERRAYKEGMNIMLLCPGGDVAQAVHMPYSPNKDHPPPDHANTSGTGEETYQLDDLRIKKTKKGYLFWFQEPQKQDQQQQGQQGQQGDASKQQPSVAEGRQSQKPEGDVVVRMHKEDGVYAKHKDNSYHVSDKGVRMKAKNDFAVVKDGQLVCSKPWQIGEDPMGKLPDMDV